MDQDQAAAISLVHQKRLRMSYIIKGRPQEIKKEIDSVLAFDPTS
jgi:hypothetical protein